MAAGSQPDSGCVNKDVTVNPAEPSPRLRAVFKQQYESSVWFVRARSAPPHWTERDVKLVLRCLPISHTTEMATQGVRSDSQTPVERERDRERARAHIV